MNLETTRLIGRPRNRWQDEVRGMGGWKTSWWKRVEGGYITEEWKNLMWMARNCYILHVPMEWMNEWINEVRGKGGWKTIWWKRGGRRVYNRGMEESHVNGKELLHSARANGMNEWMNYLINEMRGKGGWKTVWWKWGGRRVYNKEEWKNLLRMARNCYILHVPTEWMN